MILRPSDSRIIRSPLDLSMLQSSVFSVQASLEAAVTFLVAENTIREALATIITRINRMKVFLNISVALSYKTKVERKCYRGYNKSLKCVF